jgi:hypothetical protein
LLKKEKQIRKAIQAYPERQYEFQDDQLTINAKRLELIEKLDIHDKMHSA